MHAGGNQENANVSKGIEFGRIVLFPSKEHMLIYSSCEGNR